MGRPVVTICSCFCYKKLTECLQITNTARQVRRRAAELRGAAIAFIGELIASCQQTSLKADNRLVLLIGGGGFGKKIFLKLKINIVWTFLPPKAFFNPAARFATQLFYPPAAISGKIFSSFSWAQYPKFIITNYSDLLQNNKITINVLLQIIL